MQVAANRVSLWIGALMFVVILGSADPAGAEDLKLDVLETDVGTFYDVTVTSRSVSHVFFTHSGGFSNLRVETLGDEAKGALGYAVKKVERKPGTKLGGLEEVPLNPEMAQARDKMLEEFESGLNNMALGMFMVMLGIWIAMHLFFSFCYKLICEKSGYRPGLLVWIPLLQMYSLLRAARMGFVWFMMLLSPFAAMLLLQPMQASLSQEAILGILLSTMGLACLVGLVWCFKICIARGLSGIAGFLLLLPGINLIMFLYLAFAGANPNAAVQLTAAETKRWSKSQAQDTAFFMQS